MIGDRLHTNPLRGSTMAKALAFDDPFLPVPAAAIDADPAAAMRELYFRVARLEQSLQEQRVLASAEMAEVLLSQIAIADELTHVVESIGVPTNAQHAMLARGVAALGRRIMEDLGRRGVAPIETLGKPLDPDHSDAVGHEPRAGLLHLADGGAHPLGRYLQVLAAQRRPVHRDAPQHDVRACLAIQAPDGGLAEGGALGVAAQDDLALGGALAAVQAHVGRGRGRRERRRGEVLDGARGGLDGAVQHPKKGLLVVAVAPHPADQGARVGVGKVQEHRVWRQAGARGETRAIPAKGLTGPGYDGHAFWDTEMFVLPLLTYTLPDAARDVWHDLRERRLWPLRHDIDHAPTTSFAQGRARWCEAVCGAHVHTVRVR